MKQPSSAPQPTVEAEPKQNVKQAMPKRLIALLLFLAVASISGLIANQGVLFCVLTLFIVVAVAGKQKPVY